MACQGPDAATLGGMFHHVHERPLSLDEVPSRVGKLACRISGRVRARVRVMAAVRVRVRARARYQFGRIASSGNRIQESG